jgi:uncharacterized membrane protein
MVETIKTVLDRWGTLAEIFLNAISLICIFAGVIMALVTTIENRKHFPVDHPLHTRFRMVFGGWLVVALEFQLASHIVSSIISPSTQHLIELGAIALIRTFLNYFLNRELKDERDSLHTPDKSKTMMISK